MYFTYRPDGSVLSFSESKNETALKQVFIKPTEKEKKELSKGFFACVDGKKLKITKPRSTEEKEKKDKLRKKILSGKVKLKDVTDYLLEIL